MVQIKIIYYKLVRVNIEVIKGLIELQTLFCNYRTYIGVYYKVCKLHQESRMYLHKL